MTKGEKLLITQQRRQGLGYVTKEQFEREAAYRFSMKVMSMLLEKELITQGEYRRIEPILGQRFSPIWGGYPNVIQDKWA